MWQTPEARRRFFEEYAKARRFSPLIPEFWYEQSRDSLLGAKVCEFEREGKRIELYSRWRWEV